MYKYFLRFVNIGLLSGANSFILFFYSWYTIDAVGLGKDSDAFFAALALPQFFLTIFSTSLSQILLPIFSVIDKFDLHREVWAFFNKSFILFLLLVSLFHLLTDNIVLLMYGSFNEQTIFLTIDLLHIIINNILFIALTTILSYGNFSIGKFAFVEILILLSNIVGLIFLIILQKNYNIYGIAYSYFIRSVLATVLLSLFFHKFEFIFRGFVLKELLKRVKLLILGNIYFKSEIIVDKSLMSTLSLGSVSSFHFCQQIYGAGLLLFSKAFVTPLIPKLAQTYIIGDYNKFKNVFLKSWILLLLIGSGVYVIIMFFGEFLFSFLFGLGIGKDEISIDILHQTLILLGGAWIGGLLGQITSSTFYSISKVNPPVIISIISFTISLVAKIYFTDNFGFEGLLLVISIYYIINTLTISAYLLFKLKSYFNDRS